MIWEYVGLFVLSFPLAKMWEKEVDKNNKLRKNTIFDSSKYENACKKAYLLMIGGCGIFIQRWLSMALIMYSIMKK